MSFLWTNQNWSFCRGVFFAVKHLFGKIGMSKHKNLHLDKAVIRSVYPDCTKELFVFQLSLPDSGEGLQGPIYVSLDSPLPCLLWPFASVPSISLSSPHLTRFLLILLLLLLPLPLPSVSCCSHPCTQSVTLSLCSLSDLFITTLKY